METICATLDDAMSEVTDKIERMGLVKASFDIQTLTNMAYEQRPTSSMQYVLAVAEDDFEHELKPSSETDTPEEF